MNSGLSPSLKSRLKTFCSAWRGKFLWKRRQLLKLLQLKRSCFPNRLVNMKLSIITSITSIKSSHPIKQRSRTEAISFPERLVPQPLQNQIGSLRYWIYCPMRYDYDMICNDLLSSIQDKIHRHLQHFLSGSTQQQTQTAFRILRQLLRKQPLPSAPIFRIRKLELQD